jgi:hypothetical protein
MSSECVFGVRLRSASSECVFGVGSRRAGIAAFFFRYARGLSHGYTYVEPPLAKTFTDDRYPPLLRKAADHTGIIGKFGGEQQISGDQEEDVGCS